MAKCYRIFKTFPSFIELQLISEDFGVLNWFNFYPVSLKTYFCYSLVQCINLKRIITEAINSYICTIVEPNSH